ncbi:LysM peptidoglycan-binding domain-containing protein [Flavobacterium sp.]|uniref:LysM peptidoglycan-binding domain-containing protein n=1 Tax=Flavobacterium sp. TaxID=239 RepID=UPI0008AF0989|nr:LysM peptidoglycan-binding domain-containing protein [Flavobacterium sp.]OGS65526.1 MAG: lytic transglycosylase [Flavobacteria bacterium GWA2_35_26]HCF03571.1 lytic transglycosylase [Flavobacterium sp.]
MKIKLHILPFFLLLSFSLFAQETAEKTTPLKPEIKLTYLDSIKKTFVKDDLAACVDSLWLKELTNLDIYSNLTEDIQTINIDEKVDYELPTDLLKARLQEMDEKSPFHIEYNQGLENIIKSFLKNRKRSFERLMAVSEFYFPLFEEAFDKQNVPLEIKYLAVVESALNPKAVSRVGATGLWQFMYQTGKQYGLKIDSYVDERSDPLKATEAAAQYMKNMYAIFGDWDLVLASYNSGPGNVAKAIRRSGGQQNYWNIRKNLPKETQGYLPAFLATMYIYEYHKEHGIKPEKAPIKQFATDTVMIKRQMSFKQISELIDIPVAQLQILNPSYKLNVVPAYNDQTHFLRLPQDKMAVFTSNESKIYAYVDREANLRERPFQIVRPIVTQDSVNTFQRLAQAKVRYYRVKRGDNLSTIAQKYDVAVEDLKKWNNIRGNKVAYGKNLKINGVEADQKSTVVAKVEIDKKGIQKDSLATPTNSIYVVQKGDNLSNIAKKFNVTVAELQDWNKLTTKSISLGASLQVVKNPIHNEVIAEPVERKDIAYSVQKGDNLVSIAKKFGASVEELKQWNNLTSNAIAIGNSLIVAKNEIVIDTNKVAISSFKKKEQYPSTASKESEYYVKKGDSLYSISKKYPGVTISDLKKWNNIKGEELKPGMKLKING